MRPLVVFVLALSLTNCGSITATGGFTPGQMMVVSGTVSSVQVSTTSANGSMIQVTFVTLQTSGMPNQLTFCGNTASQFPMNTSVKVNFNPGQNCNQIVVVITA
ncbi:MAG: hypothetical protein LAN37_03280 [Acidobacteriia bacterium]|nr:hypothetical protein [Terriglobia bacterium]